jgi:hypothetical protein
MTFKTFYPPSPRLPFNEWTAYIKKQTLPKEQINIVHYNGYVSIEKQKPNS